MLRRADCLATEATATLTFQPGLSPDRLAISAAARAGETLFTASDESAAIDIFRRDGAGWTVQATESIAKFLSLPGGSAAEIDIEGLAVDDGWLWLTGSHALVRKGVDEDDSPKRALRRVAEIERQPNRYVLARLPLVADGELMIPTPEDGERRAGQVEAGKRSSLLIRWIAEDPMLAPYLALPSKENGFDIEGLAVAGRTVWLGLRGPVIRGHGVVLQLDIRGAKRDSLKAKKLEGGRRFRKFLLDLDGLGVRDLLADGDDLIVLGGGTTTAESPARLYRWRDAAKAIDSAVVGKDELETLGTLPFLLGGDAPEAMTGLDDGRLLVAYDRPDHARIDADAGTYGADIFRL